MNARVLCALVALCALSCAQAWPYMNPYALRNMLMLRGAGLGGGFGGGGEGGFGAMGMGGGEGGFAGGFGGGEGGFGSMGGFGGGGEGGAGAAGGEGGAGAAGGDDEAGGGAGGEGAAAGGEGGAPAGGEGGQQFPSPFMFPNGFPSWGVNGYRPFSFNRFPTFGFRRVNPFLSGNPFYRYNPQPQPWFQGPNVCRNVTEASDGEKEGEAQDKAEEEDGIRHHFSARTEVCDKLDTAYKCTRTLHLPGSTKTEVEIFECCHGYSRKPSQFGCPIELKMSDLPSTAAKLGLNQLLRALEGTSLTEELQLGTFTVFAPTDEAFNASSTSPSDVKMQEMLRDRVVVVSEPMTSLILDEMQNLLLGHLVSGMRKAHHFQDEEVVETASPEGEGIRINLYSLPGKSQLMTANCARVLSTDNQATNGIIHTVESLLRPVTDSLTDVVSKNPQLSYLKTALARANLVQTLREPGQLTLLAPTDTAFRKLKPAQLDRLLRGNPKCLEKVLLNHVLPNVICSAAVTGRAKTPNSLHSYLKLSRDEDDKLFIEGAQVIVKDIMATNGVMHLIDDVIIPEEAMDVLETARTKELSEFLKVAEKAGLAQTLTDADNVTVFVPSNSAFQRLPEEVRKELSKSPGMLRDVLRYHVVPGARRCSRLHSDLLLDTLLDDKQIRINAYNSYPFRHDFMQTAQCAPIVQRNIPACNGIIHVIDKVMLPPSGDVVDVLSRDSRFSTLVSLVKKAGLADSLQEEGPFTVFAPSNEAFEKLDKDTMNQVTSSTEALKKLLLNHVTDEVLCCSGFFERSWFSHPRVRMLGGAAFSLERHGDSRKVGTAAILDCDRSATNGVVQMIDSVLLQRRQPYRYWRGYYDY